MRGHDKLYALVGRGWRQRNRIHGLRLRQTDTQQPFDFVLAIAQRITYRSFPRCPGLYPQSYGLQLTR